MPRPKKPIKDQIVKKWLQEFKVKHTRQTYLSSLRKFKQSLNIKSLDKYVESNPDATGDLKQFLTSMDGKPSKSIAANVSALKTFFIDNNIPFDLNAMKKLRRRGFMPKRIKAETRDKKLTKTQLKKVLNYLDIKGRALVLFLLSSGARVGETVQLKIRDLELENDPPKAHIRASYTKNGVGARIVYFSYEAKDAIKDWLEIKDGLMKRNGMKFSRDKVFDWTVGTSTYMWNKAIEKARLDIKDSVTLRRVYHLHGLRKFFRTKIGLDIDIIHALMGHVEYLDESYLRLDEKGEIAQAYKEAIPNVSVHEIQNTELHEQTQNIEQENKQLKEKVARMEKEMFKVTEKMDSILSKLENLTEK